MASAGKKEGSFGLALELLGSSTINIWPPMSYLIMAIGSFFLLVAARTWHKERKASGLRVIEPSHLIMAGLIGVAFFSAIAASGYIWQQFFSPVILQAQATPSANASTTMLADALAGPHSGPIGPIAAIQFWELFLNAPKPCAVRITSSAENENLKQTLLWIIGYAKCGVFQESNVRNVDDLDIATSASGFVIHWSENNIFGEKVTNFFNAMAAKVSISHRLPPNSGQNLIWIDIGPGSPWKQ